MQASSIVHPVPGAVVVPASPKSRLSVVRRALIAHGGDFTQQRDLSHVTITVGNLEQVAEVVESLLRSDLLYVVTLDHKFSQSLDFSKDSG